MAATNTLKVEGVSNPQKIVTAGTPELTNWAVNWEQLTISALGREKSTSRTVSSLSELWTGVRSQQPQMRDQKPPGATPTVSTTPDGGERTYLKVSIRHRYRKPPKRYPTLVLRKNEYMEVSVFQIYRHKPVLGPDLRHKLLDSKHLDLGSHD